MIEKMNKMNAPALYLIRLLCFPGRDSGPCDDILVSQLQDERYRRKTPRYQGTTLTSFMFMVRFRSIVRFMS